MKLDPIQDGSQANSSNMPPRRAYTPPALVRYGDVRSLTRSGTGSVTEANGVPSCIVSRKAVSPACNSSDRRLKENLVRIGEHPLGFGLYLFDFKNEHKARHGHSRQFGVMADEVEALVPESVITRPDGYKAVDYEMLGIHRQLH